MDNFTTKDLSQETPYVRFALKDGILYVTYKKGITITLDVAKEIVRSRKEFTNNVSYPMLIKDEGMIAGDKSTRDYFSNEGVEGVSAGAFVLKSVYSTFLFNFYLTVTSPKVPFKTFADESKALKWLEQYKKK